ncbi:MAG: response regulator [Lewinellaceae bacterium]|nr:response regulator [Lewinellaceae bacterium]
MIRYMIIDDEPLAHELIKKYAADIPDLQLVKQCYQAIDALVYLEKHPVDLLFLDIQMPKLTGFQLLRTLPRMPRVIVVSAYQEYAMEGYELNVDDYLLKPYSFARFVQAVQKVRSQLSPEGNTVDPERLFLKTEKTYYQVQVEDICYVEAYGNFSKVHLDGRMVLHNEGISQLEKRLPGSRFMRVHKSYLVAVAAISAIEGNLIHLGKHRIPVGQKYRAALNALLS